MLDSQVTFRKFAAAVGCSTVAVIGVVGCGAAASTTPPETTSTPVPTTAGPAATAAPDAPTTMAVPTTTTAPPTTVPVAAPPTTEAPTTAAPTVPASTAPASTKPPVTPPAVVNVSYKNCDEVRAAGKAPLHKGEPGYSSKLDSDGDGVACEKK